MAYATGNPKTKKALREAVKASIGPDGTLIDGARPVIAFTPGGMFPDPRSCDTTIEGPHYPKPHRWYARVTVDEHRMITRVIS